MDECFWTNLLEADLFKLEELQEERQPVQGSETSEIALNALMK